MNHLQTATAAWTNVNELTINTFDSYDLLEENNYSTRGTIVTDLTYYIEEQM